MNLLEQMVKDIESKFNIDPEMIEGKLLEETGALEQRFIPLSKEASSGESKKIPARKEFVFNVQSLAYRSDVTDSSHYDEHNDTRALDHYD